MADSKLSALTELAAVDVAVGDLFYVDDISVTTGKKVTAASLRVALGAQLGTEQASTAGTSIDFTGIPAGVKRITIMFKGVSLNGGAEPLIQIGDAGGPETSGYLGIGSYAVNTAANICSAFTTGFGLVSTAAAATLHGSITLSLEDASDFTWVASGNMSDPTSASAAYATSGSKSLSAELTQVRITTVAGTATFDAGVINISYE